MSVIIKKDHTPWLTMILKCCLRIWNIRKNWATEESAKKTIAKNGIINSQTYCLDTKMKNKVAAYPSEDMQSFCVTPVQQDSQKVIIFLHGGGWTCQIMGFHWWFIDKLVSENNTCVYVPLYPKYPNATAKETLNSLYTFYQNVSQSSLDKKIVLMGDSAGGHLCLCLAQMLQQNNLVQNLDRLLLLSPATDITFSNPEAEKLSKKDLMLSQEGSQYIINQWSKPFGNKHPFVNPFYGTLTAPLKITQFAGTSEFLSPDLILMDEKLTAKGIDITTYLYQNMFHDFEIISVPQGNDVRRMIHTYLHS